MEAAVLKSTQTLKRTRDNDKTENPDPVVVGQEEGMNLMIVQVKLYWTNTYAMISWKSATESSRNNDGDAEEQVVRFNFTYIYILFPVF